MAEADGLIKDANKVLSDAKALLKEDTAATTVAKVETKKAKEAEGDKDSMKVFLSYRVVSNWT